MNSLRDEVSQLIGLSEGLRYLNGSEDFPQKYDIIIGKMLSSKNKIIILLGNYKDHKELSDLVVRLTNAAIRRTDETVALEEDVSIKASVFFSKHWDKINDGLKNPFYCKRISVITLVIIIILIILA